MSTAGLLPELSWPRSGAAVATSPTGIEAFFLDTGAVDSLFCLHHGPAQPTRGLVVYVHPFAEEMNKTRRMAALQSRQLAKLGFAVLQPDLRGCGDSSGDFGDANWAGWVDDVVAACDWLLARHAVQGGPAPRLWLWGLRVGCLIASAAAARLPVEPGLIFWQPTLRGETALNQFLRLRLAGNMLDGGSRTTLAQLRAQLAETGEVEVAGYRLNAGLADALGQAALALPAPACRVLWLETTAQQTPELAPAAAAAIERWRGAGVTVDAHAVGGPAFWQTVEIEEAPALLTITTEALLAAAAR